MLIFDTHIFNVLIFDTHITNINENKTLLTLITGHDGREWGRGVGGTRNELNRNVIF